MISDFWTEDLEHAFGLEACKTEGRQWFRFQCLVEMFSKDIADLLEVLDGMARSKCIISPKLQHIFLKVIFLGDSGGWISSCLLQF